MANDIDQVDSANWKSLRRIPDAYLRGPDREDNGKVYSPILEELQIRPEVHEAFFDGNIRPFRNKKDNSALIAKSDDDSLLKLSKLYLTAYGNLVWGKDRKWLLKPDELSNDGTSLRYIPPRQRSETDHDRFHQILAKLWKQMRDIIFEIKPSVRRNYSFADPATANSTTTNLSVRERSRAFASLVSSTMPTRRGTAYQQETPSPESGVASRQKTADNQDYRPRRPYFYEPEPAYEVSVPGYWNASRTEKVILDAITDLKLAQRESHPRVFVTLWERCVARIEEMEQYEEQQLMISTEDESSGTPGQDNTVTTQTETITDTDNIGEHTVNDTATTTAPLPEQQAEEDITMNDTTEPVQPTSTPKNPTTDRATNTETNISLSTQHQPGIPPSFPLTSYIPPTLPAIMTVYITPFSHTAMHYGQPYIWPDAPVHATSYVAFRNGIRLRANVPDSVADEKMTLVFGYGWNDFCSVVGGEDAWRNWFIKDLRRAAERGGVGVWRMRVCVVVT